MPGSAPNRPPPNDKPPRAEPQPAKPSAHAANRAYRDRFDRWPTKAQMKLLAERIADDHMAAWRETLDEWAGRAWNPANVAGMLDNYAKRVATLVAQQERAERRARDPLAAYSPAAQATIREIWARQDADAARTPEQRAEAQRRWEQAVAAYRERRWAKMGD